MGHARGKRSDLAVQVVLDTHGCRDARDPFSCFGWAQVIHRGEKTEILAGTQAAVETFVSSGVVAKLAARFCGLALDIKAAECGCSARGNNQSGEDAEQSGFSCAVWTYQRYGFP